MMKQNRTFKSLSPIQSEYSSYILQVLRSLVFSFVSLRLQVIFDEKDNTVAPPPIQNTLHDLHLIRYKLHNPSQQELNI